MSDCGDGGGGGVAVKAAQQSRIPVRRDLSLPSSGRSTPSSSSTSSTARHPPMQRETSSPPGLLSHKTNSIIGHNNKPKVPPKPKLSAPLLPARGHARESSEGPSSGRSTPSGSASRIPRPSNSVGIKKWDSTSCLEVGLVCLVALDMRC